MPDKIKEKVGGRYRNDFIDNFDKQNEGEMGQKSAKRRVILNPDFRDFAILAH